MNPLRFSWSGLSGTNSRSSIAPPCPRKRRNSWGPDCCLTLQRSLAAGFFARFTQKIHSIALRAPEFCFDMFGATPAIACRHLFDVFHNCPGTSPGHPRDTVPGRFVSFFWFTEGSQAALTKSRCLSQRIKKLKRECSVRQQCNHRAEPNSSDFSFGSSKTASMAPATDAFDTASDLKRTMSRLRSKLICEKLSTGMRTFKDIAFDL